MKKLFVILLAMGLLAGCKSVEPSAPDKGLAANAPVAAVAMPADAAEPAPIPLLTLTKTDQAAKAVQFHDQARLDRSQLIDGTLLEIDLQFGGGCEAHDIVAFAQTSAADKASIDIYLSHNAHDDRCEAWLTRTYRIDLADQIAQCRQQSVHGNLQVRLFAPEDGAKAALTVQVPF